MFFFCFYIIFVGQVFRGVKMLLMFENKFDLMIFVVVAITAALGINEKTLYVTLLYVDVFVSVHTILFLLFFYHQRGLFIYVCCMALCAFVDD